jgi:hypothetical protein
MRRRIAVLLVAALVGLVWHHATAVAAVPAAPAAIGHAGHGGNDGGNDGDRDPGPAAGLMIPGCPGGAACGMAALPADMAAESADTGAGYDVPPLAGVSGRILAPDPFPPRRD